MLQNDINCDERDLTTCKLREQMLEIACAGANKTPISPFPISETALRASCSPVLFSSLFSGVPCPKTALLGCNNKYISVLPNGKAICAADNIGKWVTISVKKSLKGIGLDTCVSIKISLLKAVASPFAYRNNST